MWQFIVIGKIILMFFLLFLSIIHFNKSTTNAKPTTASQSSAPSVADLVDPYGHDDDDDDLQALNSHSSLNNNDDDEAVDYTSLILDLIMQRNYKKTAIPPQKCSSSATNRTKKCHPFVVQSRLFLIRIQDIVESSENLLTTVRLQLGWNDSRLTWDPDEYGGVKSLVIPGGTIWTPDLQLANSVDDLYVLAKDDSFNFRLSHTGEVFWHPTAKISTRCNLDLTYYPFDYQRCVIVIESVIYQVDELRLAIRSGKTSEEAVALSMFSPNDEWQLMSSRGFPITYRTSNTTAFSRIHYWICIRRFPGWVQLVFLVPIALLSVVQLMTFVLPSHFIDRTPQATVVLLAVTVYQGSVTSNLPKTAEQSRVFNYLYMVMGMSIATVGISALTVALIEPDNSMPAPFGLPLLFNRVFRCRKKRPHNNNNNNANHDDGNNTDDDENIIPKAHIAALIINWLGFACFLFVIIVYPCVTFLEISSLGPPPLPRPPPAPDDDNSNTLSTLYYPEI